MANTLPQGKTPAAPTQPLDASAAGVVLPVLTTEPTDAMFGGAVVDGTTVYQASAQDNSYTQWVRINGTWRPTFMAQ